MTPEVGSIWRDNYYTEFAASHQRFVKVLGISAENVQIQACEKDGSPLKRGRAPKTFTRVERFGKAGRAGFSPISTTMVECPMCAGSGKVAHTAEN